MKASDRELRKIEKKTAKIDSKAAAYREGRLKTVISEKLPDKVVSGLETAFVKAFYLVFEKGSSLIEKTYNKEEIEKEFSVKNYAFEKTGGKKEIKEIKKSAKKSGRINMCISAIEGVGLGALGIGMPDIVLFISMIFRGMYETALKYGYNYDSPFEKVYMLKIMEAALSKGNNRNKVGSDIDAMIEEAGEYTAADVDFQIEKTAKAFAVELLVIKAVQGIPVAGILGGLLNPVYYHKISEYAQLKYRKRYLLDRKKAYH